MNRTLKSLLSLIFFISILPLSETQCSPGYQQTGTTCTICSAGSYSLDSTTPCIQCPEGYECPQQNLGPTACQPGTYAEAGSV